MRKLSILFLGAISSFAFSASALSIQTYGVTPSAMEQTVYVGGMPAGFTLKSGGVQVMGLCEVMSELGVRSPALLAGIRAGDRIEKVGNASVESIEQLNTLVDKSKGKSLQIELLRGNERLNIDVQPLKDSVTGRYKIGILARDSVSGIGTVTYIDMSGKFGALGHSVVGANKQQLKISDGVVFGCNIVSVNKGVRGKAGELRGMFISDYKIGNAEKLCDCGIFGSVSTTFQTNDLMRAVASSADVAPGKAYIYCTVNGECPQKYDIEIVKVDKHGWENKHYVIKIVDEALIEQTGGIVQGMSGSPIVQDGKLVGAVTHVFLNDPTRGYGIDIQTMLRQ